MISSNEPNSLRYRELNPYGLNGRGGKRVSIQRKENETETPQTAGMKSDLLVLNDTDPGSLLTMTGAQPDIIRSGEADFNGKMGPGSHRVCMFLFE